VGEVASSNLVVPTIYFQLVTGGGHPKWVHGFEPGFVYFGFSSANFRIARHPAPRNFRIEPRFASLYGLEPLTSDTLGLREAPFKSHSKPIASGFLQVAVSEAPLQRFNQTN